MGWYEGVEGAEGLKSNRVIWQLSLCFGEGMSDTFYSLTTRDSLVDVCVFFTFYFHCLVESLTKSWVAAEEVNV